MFDISEFDTYTGSNEGRPMGVLSPKSGYPAKDEDGNPIEIILLGRLSDKGREVDNRHQKARTEKLQRVGRVDFDADEQEANVIDLLCALTIGWTFKVMDGADFPCTPENVRKFWSDKRFIAIRRQALTFINDEANFSKA
jgi:hypothetical protein